MVGVDVVGRKTDAGGNPRGFALAREHKRKCRGGPWRRYFHPAFVFAEGNVRVLLESELADLEIDRLVLIGDRDHDRPHLGDARAGRRVGHFILLLVD
jgi:hypothetical protein